MSDHPVQITYDGTEDFMKRIAELTRYQVMVGIPGDLATRTDAGISNVALAYIHEFGSPARNIPARPFLVPTINRLQERAVSMMRRAAEFHMQNQPDEARNTLEALGMLAASAVKANITAGGDPAFAPLAPATIAARARKHRITGSATRSTSAAGKAIFKPLIDTGQMRQAITYVVRQK